AVDVAAFVPLDGVEFLRGDFRDPKVQALLFERLRDPADMVMSDMAPKLSGTRAVDVARALDLADAALSFAVRALRPGGIFLTKAFQGEGYREFLKQVSRDFAFVKGVKPYSITDGNAQLNLR